MRSAPDRLASPSVGVSRGDLAILRLDLVSAARDGVLLVTVLLALLIAALLVAAGLAAAPFGLEAWRPWVPVAIGGILSSAPAGPAFLFAAILIEERETGVGAALGATPTPRRRLAALRIGVLILYIALFLGFSVAAIAAAWPGLFAPAEHSVGPPAWASLAIVILSLALLGGACCLALRRFASNRVEALAVFKAMNVALSLPIALPVAAALGQADIWWRPLALAPPTGPAMEAVSRLATGAPAAAFAWALIGLAYAAALLALAVFSDRRS